jgi:dTDP-glucose 4,6-dehydratase
LYVDDHVRALYLVLTKGNVGETYNIGGNCERRNIEVVGLICDILEEYRSKTSIIKHRSPFRELVTFVKDRPGHDKRYAIDATKISEKLGWAPLENFETGLRKTIEWYLNNACWWQRILNGDYQLNRIGVVHE